MLIHTAAIEHMSGMDMYAATSEEGLYKKIADYCRSHWDTVSVDERGAYPSVDDQKCFERYFEDHEHDSLTMDVCDVEIVQPSVEALRRAVLKQKLVDSFEIACSKAGGNVNWEQARRMTLDDLSDILSVNHIRFSYSPPSDGMDAHAHALSIATAAAQALPFVK